MRALNLIASTLLSLPVFGQAYLAGNWTPLRHEDVAERGQGPELGDYLGLPINDAARLRADSWDASLLTLPVHQCKPHPSDYGMRGPANTRIWKEKRAAASRRHQELLSTYEQTRTIWMMAPASFRICSHTFRILHRRMAR
jgi:hypothetical protein